MARTLLGRFRQRYTEIDETDEYSAVVNFPEGKAGTVFIEDNQSAFGELLTASLTPQVAWRFDYGVNTRYISTTGTANGGSVSSSESRAVLSAGTSPSGTAQIATRSYLRYLPGMGGLVRFTAIYATGTANSEQLVGIGDSSDGFFFGYNGTSFGIMRRRNGSDTWTAQGSWNGTSVDFSPQLGNIYQIRFQWLGYGNIYFFVFDKTKKKYVNVHTIQYPNTSTLTHILNPTLPIMAKIQNKGNTSNIQLLSPSALGALEGLPETPYRSPLNVHNSFDATATYGDTNNNHILTIRNKSTFLGIANRVPIRIRSIDVSRGSSGAPLTRVRIYRNATTAGALSYSDVDVNNSPVETSATATTVTSTNAERAYSTSQNSTNLNLTPVLVLLPGESFTIGIQNSSNVSTEIVVTINWDEEF